MIMQLSALASQSDQVSVRRIWVKVMDMTPSATGRKVASLTVTNRMREFTLVSAHPRAFFASLLLRLSEAVEFAGLQPYRDPSFGSRDSGPSYSLAQSSG